MEEEVVKRFMAAGVSPHRIACARDTFVFEYDGTPSAFLSLFQNYYGPTMNAFEAAEKSGRALDLQKELEALFESQNQSTEQTKTVIPATFLRVTVAV
jgi:hypothetical protein